MLHIVKSQTSISTVSLYTHSDDVILLIEDAVYCANANHQHHSYLAGKQVFCLSEDAVARGISSLIADSVQMTDYRGFVSLTAQHTPSMTWN